MSIQPCSKCGHSSYRYVEKVERKCCTECVGKISVSDGAFACQGCDVFLHKSCAVKKRRNLSHEITHRLHLQHRLQLKWLDEDFICDKCLYISAGYRYRCVSACDFSLDFACASSASGTELPKDEDPLRFKDGKRKTIQHYSNTLKLSIFKYRKIHEQDLDCFWCEKHLSGVCYGYTAHKFYLHQVCSDKIPRRLAHPFHPAHPLRLSYLDFGGVDCKACNSYVFHNTCYKCEKCSFCLDMNCAKLLPTLKLACHVHRLAYFRDTSRLNCRACGLVCGGIYSICRCVQCDISFHPKCVLPSEAKSKYHGHPLILTEPVKEDDSDEFCCDVCEKERDPKHHVYYCQSCTFVAHIQCLVPEDQIASSMESEEALSEKQIEQNEGSGGIHTLFEPFIHEHEMYEVTKEFKGEKYCRGCRLVLNGPSYFCKCCGDFYLHEKCTKLPYQIRHPFHSTHPLYLYASTLRQLWRTIFITCDECKDISEGFIYLCEQCDFKLDVKCAALTSHETGVSQEKKIGRVAELHHFSHSHKIVLGYYNDPITNEKCTICELPIFGPVYFCSELNCLFIVHESCLRLPRKIQVPFHLKHMLVIQKSQKFSNAPCYACPLSIKSYNFTYNCEDCRLDLHPICATYLKRPLKCESHLDDLYYFGTDYQLIRTKYSYKSWETQFACHKCEGSCKGEPFYRCLRCSFNFHLKCVPIPDTVKSKYHRHPLNLTDSFVEDDSEKHYCDFCEEERNPKDHVYYCKECDGQTIAHIECVITREMKRREELQPPPMPVSLQPAVEKVLGTIPAMVRSAWSDDKYLQLKATIQFRNLLSIEKSPPIDKVIQAGVVPRFVEFLEREDFPQLQFEAAWALTIIASGTSENTKVVIDHGAVPVFVKLLGSPSDNVSEQSMRALGNVACDSPTTRDAVLGHGALLPLLDNLNENARLSVQRIATWTLSMFLRGKPRPSFHKVKPALPTLARLIHSNDEQVLCDACWALSYVSDGTNDEIQAVIEAGVCGPLVELLVHPSLSVRKPALRTVGNIASGDDEQTQCIISYQALPCLSKLLTNDHEMSIKKEACRTISNISSGNKEQMQAVIEADIIAPLVHLLQNAEFDIKREAARAISNATSGGTHDQIRFLVSQGCIKPLCDLLLCRDPITVKVCLKGIENILKVGEDDKTTGTTEGVNLYAQIISDARGREKIESIWSLYGWDYECRKSELYPDTIETYEKAVEILQRYWSK